MSIAFRITLIIVSVFYIALYVQKVKRGKITDRVFYFWTLFAIMLVLFSIFHRLQIGCQSW